MCGIAGFYGSFEPTLLNVMNVIQAHRGPDDEGIWFDKNYGIGFAHRRLSIRDLSSAGHQPLFSRHNDVSIIYNGEIYDTEKYYNELLKDGYYFKGTSDTEIILNLYLKYGVKLLSKLNGIFAFAIWDQRKQRLFCSRDRFGIKPFYYTVVDKVFYDSNDSHGHRICKVRICTERIPSL